MAITWEDIKGALGKAIGRKAGEPKIVITRTAGPASYATGGFTFTVGDLGSINSGFVIGANGYTADIDWANSSGNTLKIKAYTGAGTEVTAGTDLSSVYFTVVVVGW